VNVQRKPVALHGEVMRALARRSEDLARRLVAEFPAEVLARLLAIECMSVAGSLAKGSMAAAAIEERLLIERCRAFQALFGGLSPSGAVVSRAEDIEARAALRRGGAQ
jgi:hypothetical protein